MEFTMIWDNLTLMLRHCNDPKVTPEMCQIAMLRWLKQFSEVVNNDVLAEYDKRSGR